MQRLCVEEEGSGTRWMNLDWILKDQRMGCVSGGPAGSVLVFLVGRGGTVSSAVM